MLGDLCVKILAKLFEVACQQCNEGNVPWPAESNGEKRNEQKGAGWLIGATVLFRADLSGRSLGEGRGRGGTLRKESKSAPLRYSATPARKIRAELREIGCQQCKE